MAIDIEYLLVGGGGAGSFDQGGGGGGGWREGTIKVSSAAECAIQVGAGGTPNAASVASTDGGLSSFLSIVARGGGGGNRDGSSGGGGNGKAAAPADAGGAAIYGAQGFAGGNGSVNSNSIGGGGGGGAGGAGGNAASPSGAMGAGGIGKLSSISGSSVGYGGGGGGGGYSPTGQTKGLAVSGYGGGNGGDAQGPSPAIAGTANRGGGGGGRPADAPSAGSGAGGSGVVILRYLTASVQSIGSGGTITTSGGYTIHTFTSSGVFTAPVVIVAQVTGLTVQSTTEEAATLSWTATVSPVSKVLLYKNTVDVFGSATLCAAVVSPTAVASIGGLASSTLYYFWAVAMDSVGDTSTESASASGTTAAQDSGFITPGLPSSFVASGPTTQSVDLSWIDGANSAWVHIYQNTVNNSATAQLVEVALAGTQAVTVYGLQSATPYYFWIKNVSPTGGNSAFVGPVLATTASPAGIPDTPTSLTAVALDRSRISLSWTDGAATSLLVIYRAGASESFAQAIPVGAVDDGVQTAIVTGLAAATTYRFWVEPYGVGGVGTPAGPVSGTTASNPTSQSGKIDEERVEAAIMALMQEALPAKLLAIAAEKTAADPTDILELPVIENQDWIKDFSTGYNNRSRFVSYGVETSEPVADPKSGEVGRKVTLSAVAFVNKVNAGTDAVKIAWRLSRAYREVLEEMAFSTKLRSCSALVITTLSPEELQLGKNASSVYLAAGVRFYTTIY